MKLSMNLCISNFLMHGEESSKIGRHVIKLGKRYEKHVMSQVCELDLPSCIRDVFLHERSEYLLQFQWTASDEAHMVASLSDYWGIDLLRGLNGLCLPDGSFSFICGWTFFYFNEANAWFFLFQQSIYKIGEGVGHATILLKTKKRLLQWSNCGFGRLDGHVSLLVHLV
jgi:hypothetical protein